MAFYTILTEIGKAKLANATALGTIVELTQIAVGDGNGSAISPLETDTTLTNEVWRAALNSISIDANNPNWIIAEGYIPSATGGFTVREVGLFDVDGDMIAIGNYPDTYKPTLAEGAAKDLSLKVVIEVTNSGDIELKIDPAVVLASRGWTESTFYSKIYIDKTMVSFFNKPDNSKPLFEKLSPSSISIPSGFSIKVGATLFETTGAYPLNLDTDLDYGVKTPGTDYYVYACESDLLIISSSSVKPVGYDTETTIKIGGFHYGLTAEAEALTGNKTEADMVAIRGINAYSFWDLKFRPTCSPEGMVFIGGKWYDIYLLNSEHITNGTSKAGATIAGGAVDANARAIPKIPLAYGGDGTVTYGKFTWFQACEIAKSHGKKLIPYSEFPTIAYGVNEGKSSQTDLYETVVGKIEHYSNLTSKFGIEQASGTQWVWGADAFSDTSGTYVWQDVADGRGQIYSVGLNPKAVILGGGRGNGVDSGSRASYWSYSVWNSYWSIGSRFACDHLELV